MSGRNALLFAENFILTVLPSKLLLTHDALLTFIFISVINMNNYTNLNLSTLRCTEDYSYKYLLSGCTDLFCVLVLCSDHILV